MRLSGFLSVVGRRVKVAAGVAAMMMVATSAQAQTPPAAAAPASQEKPKDMFKFEGTPTGPILLMMQIKQGQETAFEEAYDTIRKGLAASTKPELQAQAKTMNLLKFNTDLPAEAARPYVVILDPPTPNVSYGFVEMLYYSEAWKADDVEVRKQIDAIFEKLKGAVVQQGVWNMVKK
ncbi:MAG TPA: hypothetical protein VMZ90_05860 [Vicinamibacterales bacterium]|nr:hypothetical protein [Vicinamibacterales bacterium]